MSEKLKNSTDDKIFRCFQCNFKSSYTYRGMKPPFSKCIVLLENAYVIKDPFSAESSMIVIGGACSVCHKDVCVSQKCSIFYTKRFCNLCVSENLKEFPTEIQQEHVKRTQVT